MPRIHLFLGKESCIHWIDQFHTDKENSYCYMGLLDVALEEDAYLHYSNLVRGNDKGWHFDAFRASLKSGSRLQTVHFMDGAKSARQDIHVRLNAPHARAELKGINLLKKSRGAHFRIFMDHQAPLCHSMQLFKGVLCGASQSSFEGKIYVEKNAQKTEAYQLNHHLILKDQAQASSKPNLEIYADDVKASHGATVSQLCEKQLHYLKTRGLSNEGAKELLISAFCREILDQIPYKFLQKRLREVLNQVIS
jgi:Fe-S cluster assembly protein SufD